MRVILHDYSGHPFQAQLSRALAARGHVVTHVSCGAYVSGKGDLNIREGDPDSLRFVALGREGETFEKYKPRKRLQQELAYACRFIRELRTGHPDVVVMCNVPLFAHAMIAVWCRRRRLPMVFWHQDVYSRAWGVELRRRLGRAGRPLAVLLDRLEAWLAHVSAQVVVIAPAFLGVHALWGTCADKIVLQENWAPLDELPERPRGNDWARSEGLLDRRVLLYSGTLGLKHDPQILLNLTEHLARLVPDFQLVVVSEGAGADFIRDRAAGLPVIVRPFQPFEDLPNVLGSADVLIVLLEAHASEYSVPSKTLSYVCAGRPVVALLPSSNPAAAIVGSAGGLAFDVEDLAVEEVSLEVAALLLDAGERARRGNLARRYAESAFDISAIAATFDCVLGRASAAHGSNCPSKAPAAP